MQIEDYLGFNRQSELNLKDFSASKTSALEQLHAFDKSNSDAGLFFRYARGRVRSFMSRQVVTICGALVLGLMISPIAGVFAFLIAFAFELIDILYLKSLLAQRKEVFETRFANRIAIITAALHVSALCVCMAIGWFAGGENFRFFVATFLAGAALNIGITYRFHREISKLKFTILILSAIAFFTIDLSRFGSENLPLKLDSIAALLLAYTVYLFSRFIYINQISEVLNRREFLNAGVRLEQNAAALDAKDQELQKLAAVAKNSNDAIAIRDKDQKFLWVNDKFCKTYGYSKQETINARLVDIIQTPKTELPTVKRINQSIADDRAIRYQIKNFNRDKKLIWLDETLIPLPKDSDGKKSYLSIARDITNLKRREIEFSRLAALAQYSTDSICFVSPEGKIGWINHGFSKVIGHTASEALGQDALSLLSGPKTDPNIIKQARENYALKLPRRFEFKCLTKGGKYVWLDNSVTPIFGSDKKIKNWIFVARDVTEAHAQSRELKKAKLDAEAGAQAKSNFLATMSHEIRTPMNGIIGMSDLLLKTRLSDEQAEFVETIVGSGEALLQIINDILDFSKLDAGKLHISEHAFDLRKTLSSSLTILEPIAKAKGLSLTCEVSPVLPSYLNGDDGRIRQIIINLVGNALKFTADGGVSVVCSCRTERTTNNIQIDVTDTGIGIPAEALDQIFETFSQADGETTRKFGGTGLGLSISKLLSLQMKGDITVTSRVGHGSTFSLHMVLDTATVENVEQKKSAQMALVSTDHLSGLKILIAEDIKTNRLLVRKMLKSTNATLIFANDGEEAVDKFVSDQPDLVLMDVSMPNKNGIEATQDIRTFEAMKNLPQTPVVALTANAFAEDQKRCLDAGMSAFLSKPIKKNILLEKINTLIVPEKIDAAKSAS